MPFYHPAPHTHRTNVAAVRAMQCKYSTFKVPRQFSKFLGQARNEGEETLSGQVDRNCNVWYVWDQDPLSKHKCCQCCQSYASRIAFIHSHNPEWLLLNVTRNHWSTTLMAGSFKPAATHNLWKPYARTTSSCFGCRALAPVTCYYLYTSLH